MSHHRKILSERKTNWVKKFSRTILLTEDTKTKYPFHHYPIKILIKKNASNHILYHICSHLFYPLNFFLQENTDGMRVIATLFSITAAGSVTSDIIVTADWLLTPIPMVFNSVLRIDWIYKTEMNHKISGYFVRNVLACLDQQIFCQMVVTVFCKKKTLFVRKKLEVSLKTETRYVSNNNFSIKNCVFVKYS